MVDLYTTHLYIHSASPSSSPPPISHSSLTNFPIIAIAVIGILATAFLLVSYYVIVIKCCLNLHRVSITHDTDDVLMAHSPARLPKGLEQSAINSIPIVEFKKLKMELSFQECSVCLGEFKVNEKLRCLRDCSHLFHMDCIDVWLQNNANCPLCRTSISSSNSLTRPPRQDLTIAETTTCLESDYVVIEIQPQQQQVEHFDRQHQLHVPPKLELRDTPKNNFVRKKHQQVLMSMGDECIDVRVKDDVFEIQPVRRSISMDSSNDQQLYLMVQDVLQKQKKCKSIDQGCSSSSNGNTSSRFKRSLIFSFGSAEGCKGSIHVEP